MRKGKICFPKVNGRVINGRELEILVGGKVKDTPIAQLNYSSPPSHFRIIEPEWLKGRTQIIHNSENPEKEIQEYVQSMALKKYDQRRMFGLLSGPRVEVRCHKSYST